MEIRTDFPRRVRLVEHLWIALPDGTRLAGRLWLPEDAEADPVPAILEAVPYRKGDGTAAGDQSQNAYLAGHGYGCLRLDLRGSGDSDGILDDEYTEQEQQDVEDVVAWLAAQPWCTGAVGMTGVSYDATLPNMVATTGVQGLRTIVPISGISSWYDYYLSLIHI